MTVIHCIRNHQQIIGSALKTMQVLLVSGLGLFLTMDDIYMPLQTKVVL